MRYIHAASLVMALMAQPLVPLHGQEQADGDGVLRAALHYLFVQAQERGLPLTGGVRLDPRPLQIRWTPGPDPKALGPVWPPVWGPERSSDRLRGISRDLSVAPARMEEGVSCTKGRRDCSIRGADVVVSVSDPVFAGGGARILVHQLRAAAGADAPLSMSTHVYTLTRAGGRWQVTDVYVVGGT